MKSITIKRGFCAGMKLDVVIAHGENVTQFEIRHVSRLVIIMTKVPNHNCVLLTLITYPSRYEKHIC